MTPPPPIALPPPHMPTSPPSLSVPCPSSLPFLRWSWITFLLLDYKYCYLFKRCLQTHTKFAESILEIVLYLLQLKSKTSPKWCKKSEGMSHQNDWGECFSSFVYASEMCSSFSINTNDRVFIQLQKQIQNLAHKDTVTFLHYCCPHTHFAFNCFIIYYTDVFHCKCLLCIVYSKTKSPHYKDEYPQGLFSCKYEITRKCQKHAALNRQFEMWPLAVISLQLFFRQKTCTGSVTHANTF